MRSTKAVRIQDQAGGETPVRGWLVMRKWLQSMGFLASVVIIAAWLGVEIAALYVTVIAILDSIFRRKK